MRSNVRLCRSICGCALLVFALAGCQRKPHAGAPARAAFAWEAAATPDSVDAIARGYLQVAVALGERDPDSKDYEVAPAEMSKAIADAYPTLNDMEQEAAALEERLAALTLPAAQDSEERTRAQYLVGQLNAIRARVRMLKNERLPFDEEAKALFATGRMPDTGAEIARRKAARAQVIALLPPLPGKDGAERYGAYDRRFLVPRDRLELVMRAALQACRARTLEHVKMPEGEGVDLSFVHNQPWSAFSRYLGHGHSTISINLDLPVTVDDALELACHEGYPGHHVFNTLRDTALNQGRHWPEMQVQLTFSPQSYVSEAMAAYAPRLAFTEAERTKLEREILFPLAELKPADADKYVKVSSLICELSSAEPAIMREYLDGRLEFVRAEQALGAEVLMDHPEAQLLYVNEYRTYMLAYTDGPRRVAAMLPEGSDDARWKAYAAVMTREQAELP